jgi:hypothetical protein
MSHQQQYHTTTTTTIPNQHRRIFRGVKKKKCSHYPTTTILSAYKADGVTPKKKKYIPTNQPQQKQQQQQQLQEQQQQQQLQQQQHTVDNDEDDEEEDAADDVTHHDTNIHMTSSSIEIETDPMVKLVQNLSIDKIDRTDNESSDYNNDTDAGDLRKCEVDMDVRISVVQSKSPLFTESMLKKHTVLFVGENHTRIIYERIHEIIQNPKLIIDMDYIQHRIRNIQRSIQHSSHSSLCQYHVYQTNVIYAVQNCIKVWSSIIRHHHLFLLLTLPTSLSNHDVDTTTHSMMIKRIRLISLQLFQLIQLSVQCGPLHGAKPGYFKRCGQDFAIMIHQYLFYIQQHLDFEQSQQQSQQQQQQQQQGNEERLDKEFDDNPDETVVLSNLISEIVDDDHTDMKVVDEQNDIENQDDGMESRCKSNDNCDIDHNTTIIDPYHDNNMSSTDESLNDENHAEFLCCHENSHESNYNHHTIQQQIPGMYNHKQMNRLFFTEKQIQAIELWMQRCTKVISIVPNDHPCHQTSHIQQEDLNHRQLPSKHIQKQIMNGMKNHQKKKSLRQKKKEKRLEKDKETMKK